MNKKYLLKGGVILISIIIVLFLIMLCFPQLRDFKVIFVIPGYVISLFLDEIFFGGTIKYPTFSSGMYLFFSILFSMVLYYFIGVLFGWVYGKIKNRKI